ncbi:MAG: DUF6279 family lipoprotein [Thiolinea sp.]
MYAAFLQRQLALLEQPELSPAQLQALSDEGWRLMQASSRQLLPDIAELLPGLDEEQRRALLANYDRKAREFEQERILPAHEQRRRDCIQRMREILNADRCTSLRQQAQVEQWAAELSYETTARMAQRQRVREEFARILRNMRNPPPSAPACNVCCCSRSSFTPLIIAAMSSLTAR